MSESLKVERILYPTDFSQASRAAFPHALELARRTGGELHMLHVRVVYTDDPNNPEYHFPDPDGYRRYADDHWRSHQKEAGTDLVVKTSMVRNTSAAGGILEYIQDQQIDLTVMGTHGRSALKQFFLGSVAERVVRHAPGLVLTVADHPRPYRSRPRYQKILVPFDFSDCSQSAFRTALEFSQLYQAHLELLYVIDQPVHPAFLYAWKRSMARELPEIEQKARGALQEFLGQEQTEGVDVHVIPGEEKTYREITRYAEERKFDLIVMGTHGLSSWERVLVGSTTEGVVRTASCPVLTVKRQEETRTAEE